MQGGPAVGIEAAFNFMGTSARPANGSKLKFTQVPARSKVLRPVAAVLPRSGRYGGHRRYYRPDMPATVIAFPFRGTGGRFYQSIR
jgi:hypothetical protein